MLLNVYKYAYVKNIMLELFVKRIYNFLNNF